MFFCIRFIKTAINKLSMAKIEFETLEFDENEGIVEVTFLKIFSFELDSDSFAAIGEYELKKNSIEFEGISKADAGARMNILLGKGFANLKNKISGKPAVYVHQLSGIPLIGNVSFGIVDRNTNIIEVKPITVCNLKCVYCSVDESMRPVDFVVEKDYIVNEMKTVLDYKKCSNIEIHIGGQGEPLYYDDLVPLVKDLAKLKQVKEISMDTNATLLNKKKVDDLVKAGMTRFNVSLNAMDAGLAQKIAAEPYNLKSVLEIIEYISKKADLIIAPVLVPGLNEMEMPAIIEFVKKISQKSKNKVMAGIQNFLCYKQGKRPAKQLSWDKFMNKLKEWEKEHDVRLLLDFKKDFNIEPTKPLLKPFKKGNVIEADIISQGRIAGEKIAAAKGVSVTLPNCMKTGRVKVKLTRTKHNIYYGSCV